MKVLLINGSPKANGTTNRALEEVAKALEKNGIEAEIFQLGAKPVNDCIACMQCRNLKNRCVFDNDIVNTIIEKAESCDGFIFGTPVYYAHPSARLLAALDRVFYAGASVFAYKPAAAVAVARRAGTVASFDVLNKYFTIARMPVVSSTYWNNVHGANAADAEQDLEGMQTMRNLGNNMAWLMKCIETGKQNGINPPESERGNRTNFIK